MNWTITLSLYSRPQQTGSMMATASMSWRDTPRRLLPRILQPPLAVLASHRIRLRQTVAWRVQRTLTVLSRYVYLLFESPKGVIANNTWYNSQPQRPLDFLDDDELTFEEVADSQVPTTSPGPSGGRSQPSRSPHSGTSPPLAPSPWVFYKGRRIHKATLCRLVITPDYIRKSHERILRVRGYTSDGKPRPAIDTDSVMDECAFVVGDLFVTFLRCEDRPCLAFMKAIALEEKGVRLERVDVRKLEHPSAQIRITGQILDMHHVQGITQPMVDSIYLAPEGATPN